MLEMVNFTVYHLNRSVLRDYRLFYDRIICQELDFCGVYPLGRKLFLWLKQAVLSRGLFFLN